MLTSKYANAPKKVPIPRIDDDGALVPDAALDDADDDVDALDW